MLRVGLTGGIASGKSTVAARFEELGAHVVDADVLAHDVILPGGPAHDAVVERFGREILGPDGTILRERLGQIVFHDPQGLRALEAIVHPEVRAAAERRFRELAAGDPDGIVVYDAALLVETGLWRDFDRLIVVHCEPETQIARLAERGMSRTHAAARIASQAPIEDKLDVAHYTIDTDGTLDETLRQAEEIFRRLREDAADSSGATAG